MKKTLLLFFMCISINAACQNHESAYWTRYALNIELKKWEVNASIEDRVAFKEVERRNLLANIVFLYKIGDDVTMGLGFAHFTTYDDEKYGLSIPELRPFQQFGLEHESNKFGFDHRLRSEQRFVRDTLGMERLDSYRYNLRVRYRFEMTYSILKKQKQQGHLGIQFKDEFFIQAGNVAENYDQNRLYGGILFQISKPVAFEIGYMWVNKNSISDPDQNSDVVRFTFRHGLDFK